MAGDVNSSLWLFLEVFLGAYELPRSHPVDIDVLHDALLLPSSGRRYGGLFIHLQRGKPFSLSPSEWAFIFYTAYFMLFW